MAIYKTLLVVTNAPTFKVKDRYCSYAPYVKELNLWFNKAGEIKVISPVNYPSDVFVEMFERQDISLNPLPFLDFRGMKSTLYSCLHLPVVFFRLFQSFSGTDHIHLRCPGNVGLIGCFVQIFFFWKKKSAKYAGNWDPQAKQPFSYRLQKWILSNTSLTRNMQVLVYGEWPGQSKNVLPFFTASFSHKVISEVKEKDFSGSLNFLFIGNLVEGKQPLETVKLVHELIVNRRSAGWKISLSLKIYGDGPERKKMEEFVTGNLLEDVIIFKGNRSLEELKAAYQKAHFVILPSRSEGWPKAIAEGMFFGCIPIATPVSCVPWMLGNGSRGVLLGGKQESGDKSQNARSEWSEGSGQWAGDLTKISRLLADPQRMKKMSLEAKKWSQQYTLERFEAAIKEVLAKSNKKSSSPFRRGGGG